MKSIRIVSKLYRPLFLVIGSLILTAAEPESAVADSVYVQIKSAKLMDQPKLWAKPVATLSYGDELTVVGEPAGSSGWYQVKARGGKSGYLHQSALSSSRIVLHSSGSSLGSGAAGAGTDQSDVVLAGKGFNSSIERQYAAGNSSADFKSVDLVEQNRVAPAELAQFIKQGRLKQ